MKLAIFEAASCLKSCFKVDWKDFRLPRSQIVIRIMFGIKSALKTASEGH